MLLMQNLVRGLKDSGIIRNDLVAEAMLRVDRGDFCPSSRAYYDYPQSIGHNSTISAPHMHACALELSLLAKNEDQPRILDVGSGSGYLTAAFAYLWGEKSVVVGIEHIPELVKEAKMAIAKNHGSLLEKGRIHFVVGDGRGGYPRLAPYNVIHVGAAAATPPQPLLDQLAIGGVMIIPIGEHAQKIIVYRKGPDGHITKTEKLDVRYVPLTDRETQENRGY